MSILGKRTRDAMENPCTDEISEYFTSLTRDDIHANINELSKSLEDFTIYGESVKECIIEHENTLFNTIETYLAKYPHHISFSTQYSIDTANIHKYNDEIEDTLNKLTKELNKVNEICTYIRNRIAIMNHRELLRHERMLDLVKDIKQDKFWCDEMHDFSMNCIDKIASQLEFYKEL